MNSEDKMNLSCAGVFLILMAIWILFQLFGSCQLLKYLPVKDVPARCIISLEK